LFGRIATMTSSTYLRRVQLDPSLMADRSTMLGIYSEDMQRLAGSLGPPPMRDHSCARLVTWNVNCLRGPDGRSTISASEAAAMLESLDADVLALQEAPVDFDSSWGDWLVEPLARLRELDAKLEGLGYKLLRSPATNPTLLATRLPISYTEGFSLDEQPVCSQNGDAVWSETRGARYAELQLPDSEVLGVYATHLHHKDTQLLGEKRSAFPGVRRREAEKLLEHWEGRNVKPVTMATLVLADFNQPLQKHYDAGEWQVVVAGLTHPAVAQPEADGVDELLVSKGFRCAYELAKGRNNFGGQPWPAMTHWTGTTIDFAYVHSHHLTSVGTYVQYSDLSDHAPVIIDVELTHAKETAQGTYQ